MKLTLSAGGGITGLTRVSSIELNDLEPATREAVMAYIRSAGAASAANYSEAWRIDDEPEVPVQSDKMSPDLQALYLKMKDELSYQRR